MSIANQPSKLSLPRINPGVETVLAYLISHFAAIPAEVWRQRVAAGKVHWHDGTPITAESPFKAQQRVYYYREVEVELVIPFEESILFQDEQLLVAFKPHFLPVMPGGRYINESLQNRLRQKTGIETLQALHRIDRVTAGLVLFSVDPATRHRYHKLFESRQIQKTYQAIAAIKAGDNRVGQRWQVSNRLVKSEPRFLMQVVAGEPNSESLIRCQQQVADRALFELTPITGRTHQLRVHMQSIGWPIENDRYYPRLQPETPDDYTRPLQLLAKSLRFIDPLTNQPRAFDSDDSLTLE